MGWVEEALSGNYAFAILCDDEYETVEVFRFLQEAGFELGDYARYMVGEKTVFEWDYGEYLCPVYDGGTVEAMRSKSSDFSDYSYVISYDELVKEMPVKKGVYDEDVDVMELYS